MGSRETRAEVSRQINCFDFQLEWFTIQKNTSFYRNFGCNRPIETIDSYDGTVHHGSFQLSRSRPILMYGLDDPLRWTLQNTSFHRRWIAI